MKKENYRVPTPLLFIGGTLLVLNGLRIVFYVLQIGVQMFNSLPEKWMFFTPIFWTGTFFLIAAAVIPFATMAMFEDFTEKKPEESMLVFYLKLLGLLVLAYIVSWIACFGLSIAGVFVTGMLINIFG